MCLIKYHWLDEVLDVLIYLSPTEAHFPFLKHLILAFNVHNSGGHVIKLGPGNDAAAREALSEWPNGLQVGGGITEDNAAEWLEAGAEKVRGLPFLLLEFAEEERRYRN